MTKTALFLGGSILGVVAIGTLACLIPEREYTPEEKKFRKQITDKCVQDTYQAYIDGFEQMRKNLENRQIG